MINKLIIKGISNKVFVNLDSNQSVKNLEFITQFKQDEIPEIITKINKLYDYMKFSYIDDKYISELSKENDINFLIDFNLSDRRFNYKFIYDSEKKQVTYEKLSGNLDKNYKDIFVRINQEVVFFKRTLDHMMEKVFTVIKFTNNSLVVSLFKILKSSQLNSLFDELMDLIWIDDVKKIINIAKVLEKMNRIIT